MTRGNDVVGGIEQQSALFGIIIRLVVPYSCGRGFLHGKYNHFLHHRWSRQVGIGSPQNFKRTTHLRPSTTSSDTGVAPLVGASIGWSSFPKMDVGVE